MTHRQFEELMVKFAMEKFKTPSKVICRPENFKILNDELHSMRGIKPKTLPDFHTINLCTPVGEIHIAPDVRVPQDHIVLRAENLNYTIPIAYPTHIIEGSLQNEVEPPCDTVYDESFLEALKRV